MFNFFRKKEKIEPRDDLEKVIDEREVWASPTLGLNYTHFELLIVVKEEDYTGGVEIRTGDRIATEYGAVEVLEVKVQESNRFLCVCMAYLTDYTQCLPYFGKSGGYDTAIAYVLRPQGEGYDKRLYVDNITVKYKPATIGYRYLSKT